MTKSNKNTKTKKNANKSGSEKQRKVDNKPQKVENKQRNKGNTQQQPDTFYPEDGEIIPFPHFRKYFKTNHPALIVGESVNEKQKEEFVYRKVTHSEKDGRHPNEKIVPNPNTKASTPMYISKRTRRDEKKFFSKWIYRWKYPKE